MAEVFFKTGDVESEYLALCDRSEKLDEALTHLTERLAEDYRAVRSRDFLIEGVGAAALSTAGVAGSDGYVAVVWRLEDRRIVIYGVEGFAGQ